MFICNKCNYETSDKSNFNHHNKSKKHLSKIQNIQIFKEKEIIEELKTKIINMENELVIKNNLIEKLEIKEQIYKDVNQSGIVKQLEEKVKELENFIIRLTGEKEILKTNNTKKIKINKYKAKDKIPAIVKNSLWRQYFTTETILNDTIHKNKNNMCLLK